MKWIEIKVIFEADNTQLAVDLIADIFYDLGLQGIVEEDPDEEPEEGWGDGATLKPAHHAIIGYIPENEKADERCRALADGLRQLEQQTGMRCRTVSRELEEEDWAESWKAFFWPERVGRRIVVKPTWRTYRPDPGDLVLEIDPGMAFGTGTHPTTSLCIRMIETFLRSGDRFLDVGTGSGILMLTAAKLGAGKLVGVDNDEVAVSVARENLVRNGIRTGEFELKSGNLVDEVQGTFNLVTANILSEVILVLLDPVLAVMASGSTLICSGIIEANRDKVAAKMKALGLEIIEVREQDGWVAIAAQRP